MNEPMTYQERILYQQAHPVRIGADVLALTIGLYFTWNHQLLAGAATILLIPFMVGMVVVNTGNLEPIRESRVGKYLKKYLTPVVEVARSAGVGVMVFGAWHQMPIAMVCGAVISVGAMLSGVIFPD